MTIYIHSSAQPSPSPLIVELIEQSPPGSVVLLGDAGRPAELARLREIYGALLPRDAIRPWLASRKNGPLGQGEYSAASLIQDALSRDIFLREENGALFATDEPATAEKVSAARIIKRHRDKQEYRAPVARQSCAVIFDADNKTGPASRQLRATLAVFCETYDVTLISPGDDPALCRDFGVALRGPEWLLQNKETFGRIIYHVENTPGCAFIPKLLSNAPGVVILHDFCLNKTFDGLPLQLREEAVAAQYGPGWLVRAGAGQGVYAAASLPMNLKLLQDATGVIAHSPRTADLAREWYGPEATAEWHLLPRARNVPDISPVSRRAARARLGFDETDVVVLCASDAEHNIIALSGFACSTLSQMQKARLVLLTGQEGGAAHGLRDAATTFGLARFEIAAGVETATYEDLLLAATIAVVLGEGREQAVYDCLDAGVPVIRDQDIVDPSGDIAQAALTIDPRDIEALAQALDDLAQRSGARQSPVDVGPKWKSENHDPGQIAAAHITAVEQIATSPRHQLAQLPGSKRVQRLARPDKIALAASLAFNFPPVPRLPRIYLDVTQVALMDHHTGIQRVVRAIAKSLFEMDGLPYVVAGVRFDEHGVFHRALRFEEKITGMRCAGGTERPVEFNDGDILLALDLDASNTELRRQTYDRIRAQGTAIWHVVYDLLPVQMGHHFPKGTSEKFAEWLSLVGRYDGAICISGTTALHLKEWLRDRPGPKLPRPRISSFHLGADLSNSIPTAGMPQDAADILGAVGARPTFLMVGTLEPRKGHAQTLAAFDLLWAEGVEANLVIIGRKGWNVRSLSKVLKRHPQAGKRLFWQRNSSDEFLAELYRQSSCLIYASEGEGFGLPLIEAARHGLPILARDLPIVREVAGTHAAYFDNNNSPQVLRDAVAQWLRDAADGQTIPSAGLPSLSWQQSAAAMIEQMGIELRTPPAC